MAVTNHGFAQGTARVRTGATEAATVAIQVAVGGLYGQETFNNKANNSLLTGAAWEDYAYEGQKPGNFQSIVGSTRGLQTAVGANIDDGATTSGNARRAQVLANGLTRERWANSWDARRSKYFFSQGYNFSSATAGWSFAQGFRLASATELWQATETFTGGWTFRFSHPDLNGPVTITLVKQTLAGAVTTVATTTIPNPSTDMEIGWGIEGDGTVASPSRYRMWIDGALIIDHSDSNDPYAANTMCAHMQADAASAQVSWRVASWVHSRFPVGGGFPPSLYLDPTVVATYLDATAPAGSAIPIHWWRHATNGRNWGATSTNGLLSLWNDNLTEKFWEVTVSVPTFTLYRPYTAYLTSDGTATGTPRSGPFRLRFQATVFSTNPATVLDTEGVTSAPTTAYHSNVQGWGAASTTLTAASAPSGAKYFGDMLAASVALAARPWRAAYALLFTAYGGSDGVGAALDSVSGSTFDAANLTQASIPVDNSFPKAATVVGMRVESPIFANGKVGLPFTAAPAGWTLIAGKAVSNDEVDVDPRISFALLHQDNDNVFGTPPMSKHVGLTRSTFDLAFLASRAVDAGGRGVNGLQWTVALWDQAALVGSAAAPVKTRPVTSTTKGGETGWADAFLVWDNALPAGFWTLRRTITTPGATGLETNPDATLTLVANNPNLVMVCGGGTAGVEMGNRHPVKGLPFLIGLAVFDTYKERVVALDPGSAKMGIARFNQAYGRPEYLAADGVTWVPAVTSADVYYHPLAVSPGDPNTFLKTFSAEQTATWTETVFYFIAEAATGGVPITGASQVQVLGSANAHDGHKFDAVDFVTGFPTR